MAVADDETEVSRGRETYPVTCNSEPARPEAGILGTNRDFALARPQLQAPLGQAGCPLPWDFHPQENPSLPGMGGASPELDRMATSTTLPSPPLETVKTSICRQRSTNISLTGGDCRGLLGSQPLGEA
ncbi:hypothetical protein CapIbe_021897 [Capra ibex]